jgi:hypothetical protein
VERRRNLQLELPHREEAVEVLSEPPGLLQVILQVLLMSLEESSKADGMKRDNLVRL